jgi:hypothetical protein
MAVAAESAMCAPTIAAIEISTMTCIAAGCGRQRRPPLRLNRNKVAVSLRHLPLNSANVALLRFEGYPPFAGANSTAVWLCRREALYGSRDPGPARAARWAERVADRERFELSIPLQVYTRSRRAPSTARPSVRVRGNRGTIVGEGPSARRKHGTERPVAPSGFKARQQRAGAAAAAAGWLLQTVAELLI